MQRVLVAAIAGTIFGLGLAVSGMINPAKVIGFLDFAGNPRLSRQLIGFRHPSYTRLHRGTFLKVIYEIQRPPCARLHIIPANQYQQEASL